MKKFFKNLKDFASNFASAMREAEKKFPPRTVNGETFRTGEQKKAFVIEILLRVLPFPIWLKPLKRIIISGLLEFVIWVLIEFKVWDKVFE